MPIGMSGWSRRVDGSKKNTGWLGLIKANDGKTMIEVSIGVYFDGKERLIPSLVPGITTGELNTLKAGGRTPNSLIDKAMRHARKQLSKKRTPFYEGNTGPEAGLTR